MTSISTRKEILSLTGIRGVAATWVVLLHLTENLKAHSFLSPQPGLIDNLLRGGGQFSVDIFFILSGFILARTYTASILTGEFFVHRIARIYPLHLLTLAMMVLGVAFLTHIGVRFTPQDNAYFTFSALPEHFFLIYVWLGMPIAWNGPTWSLSPELFAYLLFPFLSSGFKRISRPSLAWVAVLLVVAQFSFLSIFGFRVTGILALLRALSGFVVGMALARGLAGPSRAAGTANVAGAAIIVCIALGFPYLAAIPAALLIRSLAEPGLGLVHRTLSGRISVWLGRISYSIYLLHAPLLIMLLEILKHIRHLQTGPGLVVFAIIYFGVVFAISTCSFYLVENPSRYAIQNLWRQVSPA